jgi:hypothetical protein
MDRVETVATILRREIKEYAGEVGTPVGNSKFFFTEDPLEQVFCITAPYLSSEFPAELIIMAHIVDDRIVIDLDNTDKPLSDALRQSGIPDAQIVLAWQAQ